MFSSPLAAALSASAASPSTQALLSFLALFFTSLSLPLYASWTCCWIIADLVLSILILSCFRSSIFFHVSGDSHSLWFFFLWPKTLVATSTYIFLMVFHLLVASWSVSSDVSVNALKRFLSSKTNSCLVTGHASLVTSSCLRR